MAVPKSKHKVYMYTNDYNAMCTEVYKHQHNETGGNLFGLWTTSGSVVIHVVLGPGQGCRRTSTSFHQDLEYMARVGRFVNDGYMLCHIGEWHSHHNLSLTKPSAGDESTIRRNFPRGVSKFLVIIANIRNRDTIKLSPYFFTNGGERYEIADCEVLQPDGPFSADKKIVAAIELGAEGNECPENETNHAKTLVSLTVTQTPPNTRSNDYQRNVNTCPTYSQAVSRNSYERPRNTDSSTQRENSTNSTTQSQASSTNSCTENVAEPTPMDISDSLEDTPTPLTDHTSLQASNNPLKESTLGGNPPTSSGNPNEVTTKEISLKKIYDGLEKYFGSEGKVAIERNSHGDVQMTFKHDIKYWRLYFPETFPSQSAQLSTAYDLERLSKMSPCFDYLLVKPLTNHKNVLLSIKKNCHGALCKICKNITKENLAEPAATVSSSNSKSVDLLHELKNEIQMTLSTPLTFASHVQKDGSTRIEFQHYHAKWSIMIPAEFPDKPAEVYKQESSHRDPEKKTINDSSISRQQKSLVSSDLIMFAIRSNCSCSQCYRIR